MNISSRSDYATIIMTHLAEAYPDQHIPIRQIAQRENLPYPYLERITALLREARLVKGIRGKKGGHKLRKAPSQISMIDIVEAVGDSIAPVKCLEPKNQAPRPNCSCPACQLNPVPDPDTGETCVCRKDTCKSLGVWQKVYQNLTETLGSITLDNLIDSP